MIDKAHAKAKIIRSFTCYYERLGWSNVYMRPFPVTEPQNKFRPFPFSLIPASIRPSLPGIFVSPCYLCD